jgi:2-alkenal reductase
MDQFENQSSTKQTNQTVLLIGGAVFVILIFGCVLMSALGIWLASTSPSTTSADAKSSRTEAPSIRIATATPRPLVVIEPPVDGADYESAVLANLYDQVNPSVVNITLLGSGEVLSAEAPEGRTPHWLDPDSLYNISSGSGFVWDSLGHIVTNNHVIDGATEVQVTFSDGRVAVAEVVGADVDSDLAVLRIDPEGYDLLPIQRGNPESIYVGMRVAAIGNPFGLDGTLTSGIVSAMGRSIPARTSFNIPDAIQTDAAINPGNSGGPLLNEQGELVGVNAQIRSEERANSGVGFAIPVSIVERVVPELIEDGVYDHAYMGVSGQTFSPVCAEALDLPRSARGALVLAVLRGTPASRAGLRDGDRDIETAYPTICPDRAGGDLIIAIDDQPVAGFDDVLIYLTRYTAPGTEVTLTVLRDGEEVSLPLTLGKRP